MKKILVFILIFISSFGLYACNEDTSINARTFKLAQEAGYTGSYDDWLEQIKGKPGQDAREIELEIVNDEIVWRYVGEKNWKAIYSLDNIRGTKGQSAYEIYLKYHPEYKGSESQWIDDMINNRLTVTETFEVKYHNFDGSLLLTQKYKLGSLLDEPNIYENNVKVKAYWYDANNLEWIFSRDRISANIDLYAKKDKISGDNDKNNIVQLYVSMGLTGRNILNPLIEEFNAKQPYYKIEMFYTGGGFLSVKLALDEALQNDQLPALAFCYPEHVAEYLHTGKIVNMYDRIHGENCFTEEEINDFIPQFYKEGYEAFGKTEADKEIYTLPFSKSTEAMYYNTAVMKELYGDNYIAKLPKTWDELWAIGRDLKKMPGYEKWNVLGYDSESNFFINLAEQNGYAYTSADKDNHLTFNNDDNVKMLTELKARYDEGLLTTQTILGSYTSNLFTKMYKTDQDGNIIKKDGQPVLSEQGCLFSIASTAGASHQDSRQFPTGVMSIPQVNPEKPKLLFQGHSLAMFKQADPQKEAVAWEFIKELLKPDFQAKFAKEYGYMPVRLSSLENREFQEFLNYDNNIIGRTMKVAIDQRRNYFVSPAFIGADTAHREVGDALVQVLKGLKTPKDALQDAYDEATF